MGIDADIQLLIADEGFSILDLSILSQAVDEHQIGVVFLDSVTTLLLAMGSACVILNLLMRYMNSIIGVQSMF